MKKIAIAVLIAGIMMMSGSVYAGETETVEFSVEGMTCAGCSGKVSACINELEGIDEAEVSLDEGKAIVTFDASAINANSIIAAIEKVGFTAKEVN